MGKSSIGRVTLAGCFLCPADQETGKNHSWKVGDIFSLRLEVIFADPDKENRFFYAQNKQDYEDWYNILSTGSHLLEEIISSSWIRKS